MTDEQRKAAVEKAARGIWDKREQRMAADLNSWPPYRKRSFEESDHRLELLNGEAVLTAVDYFALVEVAEAAKAFTATSDQVAVASAVGDSYDAYHTAMEAHLEAHHALFDAVAALAKVQLLEGGIAR